MILLNFSHPITPDQRSQIENMTGDPITHLLNIPAQFDNAQPFGKQIRSLVDEIELTPEDWQTIPILINPPSYNFAALTLMAELHGRMGYFAPIIRLRPIPESLPTKFEVAEIINLQSIREDARKERT